MTAILVTFSCWWLEIPKTLRRNSTIRGYGLGPMRSLAPQGFVSFWIRHYSKQCFSEMSLWDKQHQHHPGVTRELFLGPHLDRTEQKPEACAHRSGVQPALRIFKMLSEVWESQHDIMIMKPSLSTFLPDKVRAWVIQSFSCLHREFGTCFSLTALTYRGSQQSHSSWQPKPQVLWG